MKVKEIIEKLRNYNEEAEFHVVVKGQIKPFEICYGYSEGCTPTNCQSVSIMLDTEGETS